MAIWYGLIASVYASMFVYKSMNKNIDIDLLLIVALSLTLCFQS